MTVLAGLVSLAYPEHPIYHCGHILQEAPTPSSCALYFLCHGLYHFQICSIICESYQLLYGCLLLSHPTLS